MILPSHFLSHPHLFLSSLDIPPSYQILHSGSSFIFWKNLQSNEPLHLTPKLQNFLMSAEIDLQQLHSCSQTQGPGDREQAEQGKWGPSWPLSGKRTPPGVQSSPLLSPLPLSTPNLDFCSLCFLPGRPARPPRGMDGFPRLEPLLLVCDNVAILLR